MAQQLSLKKHAESLTRFLNDFKIYKFEIFFVYEYFWILKTRILCNAQDYDSKKWACDGLAYLTLDADIKETLANDKASLQVLYDMTKVISFRSFFKKNK